MSDTTSPRKRRLGTSVAVVVIALVIAGGLAWWLNARAEHAAAVGAANDAVRVAIADRYDGMGTAAATAGDAAASLRLTLQEHLTVSERSDEQLATDRVEEQTALRAAADRLSMLADEPPPELTDLADPSALADELDHLEERQIRAGDLADRLRAAADASDRWAEALTRLRTQADRYVETVESQPETHDPDELAALWVEEREVLADYRQAAEATEEIEGLVPIAEAYLEYIERNVEFVEEAVALLRDDRIDEYNRRLEDAFGGDDPFGFQAAVAEATERSLQVGVIATLADVRTAALDLVVEVQEAEAEVRPSPSTPVGMER